MACRLRPGYLAYHAEDHPDPRHTLGIYRVSAFDHRQNGQFRPESPYGAVQIGPNLSTSSCHASVRFVRVYGDACPRDGFQSSSWRRLGHLRQRQDGAARRSGHVVQLPDHKCGRWEPNSVRRHAVQLRQLWPACTGAALVANRYGTANNGIIPNTFSVTPTWSSCAIEPLPASCTTGAAQLLSGNSLISSTSGPACGTSAKSGAGLITQCSMLVTNPNLKNPRSAQWNLDLQRAITNTITLDVAYIGVHGWNEIHSIDLNEPALGSGWDVRALRGRLLAWTTNRAIVVISQALSTTCTADAVAEQAARPYTRQVPLFPIHCSNHEWIHFQLRRVANDRGFPELPRPELPGFVHLCPRSRRLDQEFAGDGCAGQPCQSRNISTETATTTCGNRFRFSPTYAIPGIKSPGQMLQGWQVSAIWAWQSGFAWGPDDATTDDWGGTGENSDRTIPNPNSGVWQSWNYSGPRSAFSNVGDTPIPCYGAATGCTAWAIGAGVDLASLFRGGSGSLRECNKQYSRIWRRANLRAGSCSAHQCARRLLHPEWRHSDAPSLRNAG